MPGGDDGIAAAAPEPKLLASGRALEAKSKHAQAIAAYEKYLKAAPDDAVANGELGFAKDFVKAEATTRPAIEHSPKVHISTIRMGAREVPRFTTLD